MRREQKRVHPEVRSKSLYERPGKIFEQVQPVLTSTSCGMRKIRLQVADIFELFDSTAPARPKLQDGCSTLDAVTVTSLYVGAEFPQVRVSKAKVLNCVDIGSLSL